MNSQAQLLRERSSWQTALALVQLGRPKFLLGGIALHGLGALTATVQGYPFQLAAYCWSQLATTAIQLMTHYSNDYFDYQADLANTSSTRWSGGSRVLVRGLLPHRVALWVAALLAGVACLSMLALAFTDLPSLGLSLPVLLAMLVLSWSYSSPPLRLHTRGLGEPTVTIVVPLLTPLAGFIVQAGQLTWLPVLLCIPLSMLLMAMLLTLEFPDEAGDRIAEKKSWVVVLSARRVASLCSLLVVLGFTTSFASTFLGVPAVVGKAWLWLVPLGVLQLVRMLRRDWRRPEAWSSLEFGSIALFFFAVVIDLMALYTLL